MRKDEDEELAAAAAAAAAAKQDKLDAAEISAAKRHAAEIDRKMESSKTRRRDVPLICRARPAGTDYRGTQGKGSANQT